MKTYATLKSGELTMGGATFPKWRRPSIDAQVEAGDAEILDYDPAQDTENDAKLGRDISLSSQTVTVNGNEYDADEGSQARMLAAISCAGTRGSSTIPRWKMADNSVVSDLALADLEEALALAWEATDTVWLG